MPFLFRFLPKIAVVFVYSCRTRGGFKELGTDNICCGRKFYRGSSGKGEVLLPQSRESTARILVIREKSTTENSDSLFGIVYYQGVFLVLVEHNCKETAIYALQESVLSRGQYQLFI